MFKSRMLLLFSFVLVFAQPVWCGDSGALKKFHRTNIQKLQNDIPKTIIAVPIQKVVEVVVLGKDEPIFSYDSVGKSITKSLNSYVYPVTMAALCTIPRLEPIMKNWGMFDERAASLLSASELSGIVAGPVLEPSRNISDIQRILSENMYYIPFQMALHFSVAQLIRGQDLVTLPAGKFFDVLKTYSPLQLLTGNTDVIYWSHVTLENIFQGFVNSKTKYDDDKTKHPENYKPINETDDNDTTKHPETYKPINETDDNDTTEDINNNALKNHATLYWLTDHASKIINIHNGSRTGFIFASFLVAAGSCCFGWTLPVFSTMSYWTLMIPTMATTWLYECPLLSQEYSKKKISLCSKVCEDLYAKIGISNLPQGMIQTMGKRTLSFACKTVIPTTFFLAACLIMPYMQTAPAA